MLHFLHWRSLFRRKKFEAEMEDEFAFHREARAQDLIRQGLSPQAAKRLAQQEFGAVPRYAGECREAHRLQFLDELLRDIRYSWRSVKKNPGFAAAAILSLALGIGMNTVVFSVFESLLLRSLPIADPDQLVNIETSNGGTQSFPNYQYFRDNNATFSGVVGYRMSPINLETEGNPQRTWGYLATGNYFDVLGLKPAIGRFFHQEDDLQPGASPYAVLSYRAWQIRFGSDPEIVGRAVRLNGLTYRVLGVAPEGFHGTELFYWPDMWVPMMMQPQIEAGNPWLDNRYTWNTMMLGKLKKAVTEVQAVSDLNRLATRLARQYPETDRGLQMKLAPVGLFGSSLHGVVKLFLGGLLLIVGLVLLTACLNLAGLILARSADRQREMAIRLSIGAGAGRIIRQVLTEAVILSMAGGVAACGLAVSLCHFLSKWKAPVDFPLQFDVTPDWRVFLFAALLSLATGMFFGFAPALQLSKVDLNAVLKGQSSNGLAKPRFHLPLRDLLVVCEIALCFVLVFCSLLSLESLRNALTLPLGFNPESVSTLAFDVGLPAYNQQQGDNFRSHLLDSLKGRPGVISAAFANSLPLSMDQSTTGVHADGEVIDTGRQATRANYYQVSPGFWSALRIPLLKGRDFDFQDTEQSPPVAIVNEAFAKAVMHTDDPVGKTFRRGPGQGVRVRVIGLLPTGKYVSLTEAPRPVMFSSIHQIYNSTTTLVIRSARPSSEVVNDVRRLISGMDRRLPVYGTGSLSEMLGFALFPMRAAAIALTAFGLLAIVLAMTGINGLVTYAVSRRQKEIGVRVALGATSFGVMRFLLTKLLTLVASGLTIGVVLALLSGRALGSVIYVASPRNAASLVAVLVFLLLTAVLSCWAPTLRALRMDPLVAIRHE